MSDTVEKHAVRDPVHGWIHYSTAEMAIIDSPLVQRLRWVTQLTSVNQVYPGGTHSRFAHSLGAMHLAGLAMSAVLAHPASAAWVATLPTELRSRGVQLARLYGLLHDIGHGPFSHAFDRVVYAPMYGVTDGGHDYHRDVIVRSSELKGLIEACGVTIDQLCLCWKPNSPDNQAANVNVQRFYAVIDALVVGPLGADRMDFTLRDSYFTGTEHLGTIAHDRIIDNCYVIEPAPRPRATITYAEKVLQDVIQALTGRYQMYSSVYLHRCAMAGSYLLEEMMREAAGPLRLAERTLDMQQWQWLNEMTLVGEIMAGPDSRAKQLAQMWLQRRLPKLISEAQVTDPTAIPRDLLPGQFTVVSRFVTGVDPTKFDQRGISFGMSDCATALAKIHYRLPYEPISYLRVYTM